MMYELPWYDDRALFVTPPNGEWKFCAQDYALADALGVASHHVAQDLVRDALVAQDATLAERIEFDSEYSCFFAYSTEQSDMAALASLVAELVATRVGVRLPGERWDPPMALEPASLN